MSVSHAILKYAFGQVLSGYQDFTPEAIEVCKALVIYKLIYTSEKVKETSEDSQGSSENVTFQTTGMKDKS